jgi:hypothetical protein
VCACVCACACACECARLCDVQRSPRLFNPPQPAYRASSSSWWPHRAGGLELPETVGLRLSPWDPPTAATVTPGVLLASGDTAAAEGGWCEGARPSRVCGPQESIMHVLVGFVSASPHKCGLPVPTTRNCSEMFHRPRPPNNSPHTQAPPHPPAPSPSLPPQPAQPHPPPPSPPPLPLVQPPRGRPAPLDTLQKRPQLPASTGLSNPGPGPAGPQWPPSRSVEGQPRCPCPHHHQMYMSLSDWPAASHRGSQRPRPHHSCHWQASRLGPPVNRHHVGLHVAVQHRKP